MIEKNSLVWCIKRLLNLNLPKTLLFAAIHIRTVETYTCYQNIYIYLLELYKLIMKKPVADTPAVFRILANMFECATGFSLSRKYITLTVSLGGFQTLLVD